MDLFKIFTQKARFWRNIEIFVKSQSLVKNRNFGQKNRIFYQK